MIPLLASHTASHRADLIGEILMGILVIIVFGAAAVAALWAILFLLGMATSIAPLLFFASLITAAVAYIAGADWWFVPLGLAILFVLLSGAGT